jgi:hypothetical protein
VDALRKIWCELGPAADPAGFTSHGQDLVEQLQFGVGWRITGACTTETTRSVLVASEDPLGVKFVVTCALKEVADFVLEEGVSRGISEKWMHFGSASVERFFGYHRGKQGIGVLGFAIQKVPTSPLICVFRILFLEMAMLLCREPLPLSEPSFTPLFASPV